MCCISNLIARFKSKNSKSTSPTTTSRSPSPRILINTTGHSLPPVIGQQSPRPSHEISIRGGDGNGAPPPIPERIRRLSRVTEVTEESISNIQTIEGTAAITTQVNEQSEENSEIFAIATTHTNSSSFLMAIDPLATNANTRPLLTADSSDLSPTFTRNPPYTGHTGADLVASLLATAQFVAPATSAVITTAVTKTATDVDTNIEESKLANPPSVADPVQILRSETPITKTDVTTSTKLTAQAPVPDSIPPIGPTTTTRISEHTSTPSQAKLRGSPTRDPLIPTITTPPTTRATPKSILQLTRDVQASARNSFSSPHSLSHSISSHSLPEVRNMSSLLGLFSSSVVPERESKSASVLSAETKTDSLGMTKSPYSLDSPTSAVSSTTSFRPSSSTNSIQQSHIPRASTTSNQFEFKLSGRNKKITESIVRTPGAASKDFDKRRSTSYVPGVKVEGDTNGTYPAREWLPQVRRTEPISMESLTLDGSDGMEVEINGALTGFIGGVVGAEGKEGGNE